MSGVCVRCQLGDHDRCLGRTYVGKVVLKPCQCQACAVTKESA